MSLWWAGRELADVGWSDPTLRNVIKPALSLQFCVMLANLRNDTKSAKCLQICVLSVNLRNTYKSV